MADKYVNLFTEEDLETHFDKWLYLLKNLSTLEKLPAKIREKIFQQALETAEIAKLTKIEPACRQGRQVFQVP